MKALIGSLIVAALVMCGPLFISIPVMAGDGVSLTRVQDADARRQEWLHVQWQKLMTQARAQRYQLERWRRARLRGVHAHTKSSVTKKKSRIAAELTR